MTSWATDQRPAFQARLDILNSTPSNTTNLDNAIQQYIAKGGIAANAANSSTITSVLTPLNNLRTGYITLNDDITNYLKNHAEHAKLGELLGENGDLQKQLIRLTKIKDGMKVDVETAIARDELLRSRDTDITPHTLYLLNRPIRRSMIPYLWVFSVLFIGIGVYICMSMFPTTGVAVDSGMSMGYLLLEFFSDKVVLTSLLVSALIVIFFLALKIVGVFGK
jgi:hypothetical protein